MPATSAGMTEETPTQFERKSLQLHQLLTKPKEITMNKLILALALAFALVAGAVTVTTLQPQPAMADPNAGGCNGC